LKFALARCAPKTGRDIFDRQFCPLRGSSIRERFEGKLKGIRDHAAQSADPKADFVNAACARVSGLLQHLGERALHDG
jgi:hypothetical protein